MTQSADVIVVGAGHNGLVAGSYLARAGARVLIVEADQRVGGMTSTNPVIPGAPHHLVNEGAMDASLIRSTSIVRDLELERHGLREVVMDPIYAYLDPDGASLCVWRNPERTADELRRFSAADARAYLELANEIDSMMNFALPYMTTHPLRPAPGGLLRGGLRTLRHPRRLGKLGRYMTASHAEVIEDGFSNRMVRGLLAALPCFAPITQDGTAWVLVYFGLIHRAGVSRYVGGTGAITDALARCFAEAGGEVRCSAPVEEIIVRGGRAAGVRLESGEELSARAVITTANVKSVLTEMLPEGALPEKLTERARHIPTSGTHASSFKLDLALSGRVELTAHQTQRSDGVDLRLPALCYTSFEEHVDAWDACARGELPDPLPVITILPTAADPSQAPAGQDTLWSWTGIATAHPRTPWSELAEPAAKSVQSHASRFLTGLDELEIGRQVMTPDSFTDRFRAPDGNVYHVDPTAMRFGPLRPAVGLSGYRTPIEGLYVSGGGTHPSAGICGVPGQLAAREALRGLGSIGSRPEKAWKQASQSPYEVSSPTGSTAP
jgi:phytoene dehydrogenase-like protein